MSFNGFSQLSPAVQARYEPLRVLGTGAMGTVVLARERELGRLVALKLLRENCPGFQRRLRHEARLMARLPHPAIVPVYAFEGGERPCLVMRYVPGGSLATARLEPRELARTLRGIAEALAFAHARGVVHRDVKPANVLLEQGGQALLSDFGLALEPRAEDGRAHLPVAGTLLTMSPEQVRGERVGPASDQFSLGVTFYRQLTGSWPFRGRVVSDLVAAIEHEQPVPPRALEPGVPRALERIVLRSLAKDPSRRFATLEEFGAELERFLGRPAPFGRLVLWLRSAVAPAPPVRGERRLHPPSTLSLFPRNERAP